MMGIVELMKVENEPFKTQLELKVWVKKPS